MYSFKCAHSMIIAAIVVDAGGGDLPLQIKFVTISHLLISPVPPENMQKSSNKVESPDF